MTKPNKQHPWRRWSPVAKDPNVERAESALDELERSRIVCESRDNRRSASRSFGLRSRRKG